jgi:hypothetical protein
MIVFFAVTGDNEAIVDGTVDAGAGREYTQKRADMIFTSSRWIATR